jgi:RND family efflux transporter MFP subunit
MLNTLRILLIFSILFFSFSGPYAADKKEGGMPPSIVVVSEVGKGMIAPESVFIGTVYYHVVSDVASEVSGKVEHVSIDDGQRVKEGDVLVRLGSDLLNKTLQAAQANYEEVLTDLEKEELNLKRTIDLYINKLISEKSYDEQRLTVHSLKKKSSSLKADLERLQVELGKKIIKAPFDGIVVQKQVYRGEWLDEGSTVATIAEDSIAAIIPEVPEAIIAYVKKGMMVNITAGGKHFTGKFVAVIPKGDIATRTFPVKIIAKNTMSLIQGMEARVTLPSGKEENVLTVNRDAVINVFGTNAVFIVNDSKAKMVPVTITGYKGMTAGVQAEGLKEGMKVVIKGNERLRDGQAVQISEK